MDTNNLFVTVRNRDGIVYEGECQSFSSYNDLGKFDVLGKHANFITLVGKEINIKTKNGDDMNIPVDNGVCKVRENRVSVFMGIRKTLTTAAAKV